MSNKDHIIGTFTYDEIHPSSTVIDIVNQDYDDLGYLYYVDTKGGVHYDDNGTFEPLIPENEPLPEEDGWGIVDTLTDEDK